MKLSRSIIIFFSLSLSLLGCAKEEKIESTDTTVGQSKIIFFPTIATIGQKLIIVNQGAAYTEAGANAVLAGAPATYTTSGGPVNTAVPGVYNIKYLAANPGGIYGGGFQNGSGNWQ